ncbi:hypothetical protein QUB33_03130 [Microcoleus sp. B3-A4]|uniref:hypothetical protein n=1 Tax=Microcoleus sp. B3-A4 TaxID=2818653 RepID=UPI002FD03B53
MICNTKTAQKNGSQKLADISLTKNKSNQLWSELSEDSEATVIGGLHKVDFASDFAVTMMTSVEVVPDPVFNVQGVDKRK